MCICYIIMLYTYTVLQVKYISLKLQRKFSFEKHHSQISLNIWWLRPLSRRLLLVPLHFLPLEWYYLHTCLRLWCIFPSNHLISSLSVIHPCISSKILLWISERSMAGWQYMTPYRALFALLKASSNYMIPLQLNFSLSFLSNFESVNSFHIQFS